VAGSYVTAGITITDNELINNVGYVKRSSCVELTKMTRMGTLMPEENRDETISISQWS